MAETKEEEVIFDGNKLMKIYSIKIDIIQAKGLKKKAEYEHIQSYTIDPFVRVLCGNATHESNTQTNTLSPSFNDTVEFAFLKEPNKVEFMILDAKHGNARMSTFSIDLTNTFHENNINHTFSNNYKLNADRGGDGCLEVSMKCVLIHNLKYVNFVNECNDKMQKYANDYKNKEIEYNECKSESQRYAQTLMSLSNQCKESQNNYTQLQSQYNQITAEATQCLNECQSLKSDIGEKRQEYSNICNELGVPDDYVDPYANDVNDVKSEVEYKSDPEWFRAYTSEHLSCVSRNKCNNDCNAMKTDIRKYVTELSLMESYVLVIRHCNREKILHQCNAEKASEMLKTCNLSEKEKYIAEHNNESMLANQELKLRESYSMALFEWKQDMFVFITQQCNDKCRILWNNNASKEDMKSLFYKNAMIAICKFFFDLQFVFGNYKYNSDELSELCTEVGSNGGGKFKKIADLSLLDLYENEPSCFPRKMGGVLQALRDTFPKCYLEDPFKAYMDLLLLFVNSCYNGNYMCFARGVCLHIATYLETYYNDGNGNDYNNVDLQLDHLLDDYLGQLLVLLCEKSGFVRKLYAVIVTDANVDRDKFESVIAVICHNMPPRFEIEGDVGNVDAYSQTVIGKVNIVIEHCDSLDCDKRKCSKLVNDLYWNSSDDNNGGNDGGDCVDYGGGMAEEYCNETCNPIKAFFAKAFCSLCNMGNGDDEANAYMSSNTNVWNPVQSH